MADTGIQAPLPALILDRAKFRELRINAGLSPLQLSMQTGIPRVHLWGYETGRQQPRPKRLKILADHLGCKPTDLLTEAA